MKILGIGESVIDRVVKGKITKTSIGGPILTALIFLSRLNKNCTFLTCLGQDNNGLKIKSKLEIEEIQLIAQIEQKTKVNKVIVDELTGQRTKLRGSIKHRPIKNIPEEFIRSFDLILIDRHEKTAFYEVIQKKKLSAKVIIDPSTESSDFTRDMVALSDYPIIPIESVTPTNNVNELRKHLKRIFINTQKEITVTAGDKGSFVYDGKILKLIPPLKVNAIDATGAGDIFRGAFAYGVLQKWDHVACCKFANKISALQCTKLGNVDAIPSISEIHRYRHGN